MDGLAPREGDRGGCRYRRCMRWEDLFADLEGQAQAFEKAEVDAEVADRIRSELAQLALLNRLRAQLEHQIVLSVTGVGSLHGRLTQVGADWLLLSAPDEVVIPVSAIAAVSDLPFATVSAEGVGHVSARIPMTAALRAIAIDRCAVTVQLRGGDSLKGTPDRVGADFVDLAIHERDEAPRRSTVRRRMTVAFGAIGAVRRSQPKWT